MLKEAIVKQIIVIDDRPEVLEFVTGLFKTYGKENINFTSLLFCGDKEEVKNKDETVDIYEEISKEKLFSEDFINKLKKKMVENEYCCALIDIKLTKAAPQNYKDCESVKFAEELVDMEVVKKSRIFFYSLAPDLALTRSKFRKDTNGNWKEPLDRPVSSSGMDNEEQKIYFVNKVMNSIYEISIEGEDE